MAIRPVPKHRPRKTRSNSLIQNFYKNPKTPFAFVLHLADALLTALIIAYVPYTKIDWDAYMSQVNGFIEGGRDYNNLKGDTGPLVYPAGFLYTYSAIQYFTGGEVYPAQVYCYHDLVAVKRVAGRRTSREGDEFYYCASWPDDDCKFFMWKDEVDRILHGGADSRHLQLKNQALQLRNSSVEAEKMMLEEEIKMLKLKLGMSNLPITWTVGVVVLTIAMNWLMNK